MKPSFPNKTEKALYFSLLFLSWLYMENTMYRSIVREQDYWFVFRFLQFAFLALAAAAVIYLFVARRPGFGTWPEKRLWLRGFCSYEQLYILYVFFWYIVCVLMRNVVVGGSWFKRNDPWMFITGVMAFLMVPLARYTAFRGTRKPIEILMHLIVIPFALFTAFNLWRFFHGNMLIYPSGHHLYFAENILMMYTNMHHNFLGRQAMVMLAFSLYMIITQKPAVKVVYAFCFPVFLLCLILTNSRNCWYTSALIMACAVFLTCWDKLESKEKIFRAAVSLLAVAAVAVACHWIRGETFVWLDKALPEEYRVATTPALQETSFSNPLSYTLKPLAASHEAALPLEEAESAASNARSFDDNLSTLGNRLPLYKASFRAMFARRYQFFFGVTPVSVDPALKEFDGVDKDYNYGHAHNFFLQMGVAYGFPTMLLTIVFAVSLLIRGIRIMFFNRKKLFSGAWLIPLITLAFLANDMLEAGLNSDNDIFCASFYLHAGWTVLLDQQARKSREP